jgi:hypothetical protein
LRNYEGKKETEGTKNFLNMTDMKRRKSHFITEKLKGFIYICLSSVLAPRINCPLHIFGANEFRENPKSTSGAIELGVG